MPPITRFLDTSPTIEKVREKIEALRADIRTLEGYCNARLLIVSRLPNEVLSIIFEYVAAHELRQSHKIKPHARWLPVSQVCRLWRNVAINTPRIWGTIYFHNKLELARLFLERSKSAPLHIKSNCFTPNLDVAALWFSHASRLRTIDLNVGSLDTTTWTSLFKTLKAPNLEALALAEHHATHFDFATEVDADHVARLREVKLHDCYFDLRTPYLSEVRSLNIWHAPFGITHRPMLEIMLALKNMKYLESLELAYLLEFSADVPKDLRIELPRLHELTIKTRDPRVVLMLWSFSCVNIRTIVADTMDVVESGELAKQIVGAFHSVVPNSPWSTQLEVRYGDSELKSTIYVELDPTSDSQSPPISWLELRGPIDFSACLAFTSVFLKNPPKTLDISLGQSRQRPAPYDREGLIAFMRSLESVETLTALTAQDLLAVLSDVPNKTQLAKARRGTFLPYSLQSLKEVNVTHCVQKKRHDRTFSNLQKALERRRNINAGIEILRFSSTFNRSELEILRPEVQTMEYSSDK
ncbi:hypothetical protein ONZ45_g7859 [Pleurotus djamor]|nr:hypothetical protein ONZ45_g7859 [Pleurotus djamor]